MTESHVDENILIHASEDKSEGLEQRIKSSVAARTFRKMETWTNDMLSWDDLWVGLEGLGKKMLIAMKIKADQHRQRDESARTGAKQRGSHQRNTNFVLRGGILPLGSLLNQQSFQQ